MNTDIDYDGPAYPYRQVAASISDAIAAGEIGQGQRIPSEQDIIGTFGVSRGTARRAVALLRDQKAIFTVPGRGSFAGKAPRRRGKP